MEDNTTHEYLDNFLSQIEILCCKINIPDFSCVKKSILKGNEIEKISNILFPFNAVFCQYIFFVFFDEPKNFNKNNHIMLLYCFFKCWRYAIKTRNDFLGKLEVSDVNKGHFTVEDTKAIMKIVVEDRKDMMHKLIDYLNENPLDSSFSDWTQQDIIVGEKIGRLLYGSNKLANNSIDLAIPFIITNDLLESLKICYPFHVDSSSIVVLRILKSPFPIEKNEEKITYISDNSNLFRDKTAIVIDTEVEDLIQINNTEDISRNSLVETIKPERKNHGNDLIVMEDR